MPFHTTYITIVCVALSSPLLLHPFFSADFFAQGFVELPGAGHCPMDEAPHLTDPVVLDFVAKHFNKKISK